MLSVTHTGARRCQVGAIAMVAAALVAAVFIFN